MISALAWVPKGACAARPVRYEVSAEEVKEIERLAAEVSLEGGAARGGGAAAAAAAAATAAAAAANEGAGEDGLPRFLNMDKYDEEEAIDLGDGVEEEADAEDDGEDSDGMQEHSDEDGEGEDSDGNGDAQSGGEEEDDDDVDMGGAAAEAGMAFTDMGGIKDGDEDSDENEDDEYDHTLKPMDAVLLTALTDDDECSTLEVQVYDQDSGSYFTHHDIALPALPLCLAWMSTPPTGGPVGSYVAIGTFEPAIEIWNLDVLDPLEPTVCLGGLNEAKKKKKKKQYLPGSHKDAVMALSWNALQQQLLASGGADNAVKIWDVTTQTCGLTLDYHTDKVQSVSWHLQEAAILATAGFDKRAAIQDVRNAADGSARHFIPLTADPECLLWDPHNGASLLVGCEDGRVSAFDVRSPKKPLYTFVAHDSAKGLSDASFSPHVCGLLATCSMDKTVKLWDVEAGACKLIATKDMEVGKLFSTAFYPDTPYLLAAAGSKGLVALWHADSGDSPVEKHFLGRTQSPGAAE